MAYYFAFIWYALIAFFSFVYIMNIDKMDLTFMDFIDSKYFRMFWNFPLYIFMEILFLSLIFYDNRVEKEITTNSDTIDDIHVIIPAHKANETIKGNIGHLVDLFHYNIWIAENDGKPEENEFLKELCQKYQIHYVHYDIANKTNALYLTAKIIREKYPTCKNIILLDDDTVLPSNFFVRHDLLKEETTAGYCCCIGIKKNEKFNLIEHWVDWEYRTISFRNRARNYQTLKFLHGIICVYRLDAFLEIFRFNPCLPHGLPFGEDAFAGVSTRMLGYQMKQDNLNTVLTYCPNQLFSFWKGGREQGYGASSLFKQRALRWYLSWPRRLFHEISLFISYDTGTWFGNILYRVDCLWYVFILYVSIIWMHFFQKIIFGDFSFSSFSYVRIGFMIVSILSCYLRFFIMNEQEKKNVNPWVLFTFPFFLLFILFLYGVSFLLSIFYYIPFKRIDYQKCFGRISN